MSLTRFIKQESVQEVTDSNIVDVISHYVNLQKNGSTYKALSPFTEEKTPSFVVSPSKNIFKCFSTGIGGDAIKFVMEIEKIEFIEAVKKVAEITHKQLEYTECSEEDLKQWKAEQLQKKSKSDVLQFALDFFLQHNASEYLKNRTWTKETIEEFEIGFAPGGNLLVKEVNNKGLDMTNFLKYDLIGQSEKGMYYDTFQERIIIPIFDKRNHLVAFTGRNVIENSKYPKYRNSSDKVYTKGNHFFGLNKALQSIEKTGFVYLVEGTPDAIAMHNKGLKNTIATNGTAFTDKQLNLLTNITKRVCIVPQQDKAGLKALETTAQRLIKEGLEVKVLFPTKGDADEFVRTLRTDEELFNWQKDEEDYIFHFLSNCLKNAQLSPLARVEEIENLGALLETIEKDVARQVYYDECKGIWAEFGKNYKLKKRQNKVSDALKDIQKEDKSEFFNYGFWETNNCYYTLKKEENFTISNFTFEPLFFIRSGNESKYYLQLKHQFGLKSYVTISTDDLISPANFQKIVERKGAFHFYGTVHDLYKIKDKKFHGVNRAYEHDVLGQKDSMYIWSNGIYFNKKFFTADKNGIVEMNKDIESLDEFLKLQGGEKILIGNDTFTITHPIEIVEKVGEENLIEEIKKNNVKTLRYTFLACASSIIQTNEGEDNYAEIRKFKYNPSSKLTLKKWSETMVKVYPRGNGMIAVAWGIMAIYRDIIFGENNNWNPLLFCFGLPQKGKSKIAESIASLSGIPKEDGINLEGGSTDVGIRRFMSSRKNSIIWLNEYKNDLSTRMIGMLKGLADGSGKLQGQKTGGNETTHYKPLSSAVICGQDLPTKDPALLSRCILLELDGHYGTQEDYEQLKDWEKNYDVTGVTAQILDYRPMIKENYRNSVKIIKDYLREEMPKHDMIYEERLVLNLCSVLAPIHILKEHNINLGFSLEELLSELFERSKFAISIRKTASEVEQFFAIIMAHKEVREGFHYKIKKNKDTQINELFLRITHVHGYYIEKAKQQDITALHMGVIQSYLQKHISYINSIKDTRFSELKNSTSAMIFNYDKLLQHGIEFNSNSEIIID